MESVDILPPEKIAFIAYNIRVYESVQKFGRLITSGKITNSTDAAKVAELLSESVAFYDAEMIAELINVMLQYTQGYCRRSKQYNESTKSCRNFYSMIFSCPFPERILRSLWIVYHYLNIIYPKQWVIYQVSL
jgi:hypothetical protein